MIKLIIFDLDGVLVDAKEIHYKALNQALCSIDEKYIITRAEHLSTYDGLPTKKKLNVLTEKKGLPLNKHDSVWNLKQTFTRSIIENELQPNKRLYEMLCSLKKCGYIICVASNSIRDSIETMLIKNGTIDLFSFYYSNQDVTQPKPSTEMYLRCMIDAHVDPVDTLIIEDSNVGRTAAQASGAHLCAVRDVHDVTLGKITDAIRYANGQAEKPPKWQGGKMNVLIPMAGAGSRFEKAGYTFPKPLIEVNGKPMIQTVVDNLNVDAHHIFIVQKTHYEKYNLLYLLNLITPHCTIIQVDGITEGAACTTLLAKELINTDEPLLMANSDQFIEWDSSEFMYAMTGDLIDGGILTFKATHPKWSFARLGEDGFVAEVAEKMPISDTATVGIYYWKKGSDYVKYAERMIKRNVRTNGEFYVCPVFNEAISDGKKIRPYQIKKMWGLGTPEDLERFISENEK